MPTISAATLILNQLYLRSMPPGEVVDVVADLAWTSRKLVLQALLRLEERGLIASEDTASGRVLRLTGAGEVDAVQDVAIFRRVRTPEPSP